MAIRETVIKIDDRIVGHITTQGRYLDRAAFLALRQVERLRAYLGLVAPSARRGTVCARVCRIHGKDVYNFLIADVRRGRVVRLPGRQGYALVKEAWGFVRVEAAPGAADEEQG